MAQKFLPETVAFLYTEVRSRHGASYEMTTKNRSSNYRERFLVRLIAPRHGVTYEEASSRKVEVGTNRALAGAHFKCRQDVILLLANTFLMSLTLTIQTHISNNSLTLQVLQTLSNTSTTSGFLSSECLPMSMNRLSGSGCMTRRHDLPWCCPKDPAAFNIKGGVVESHMEELEGQR